MNDGKEIFVGPRDPTSGLWMVDLAVFASPTFTALPVAHTVVSAAAPPGLAAPAVRLQSKEEFVKATFVLALKDFLIVPGLSADDVKKYLPNSVNTALGHLDATGRISSRLDRRGVLYRTRYVAAAHLDCRERNHGACSH